MKDKIIVKNLSKHFGNKKALDGLNLTINKGMFGLLGRNGAGKTTFMKILSTLINKTDGSINMCGIPINNCKEIRRIVGYLPQDFSIYPNMKIKEILVYLGLLSGMDRSTLNTRIQHVLRKVNLNVIQSNRFKTLSGGMKRRLGIAQAILHNPKVLIVDEPTSGLDPEERVRFRNLLCELAEERIVILSTHIVGDIEATCENIAILDEGKLVFDGTTSKLINEAIGYVYSMTIQRKELPYVKSKYFVTSMVTKGTNIDVNVLSSEKPSTIAMKCEPSIEEAYMLCLYNNGVRKNKILGGDLLDDSFI